MRSLVPPLPGTVPGRVSYLVSSYNHLPYLRRCLESILDQDYRDIELLVCDDHSTDGSRDFLDAFASERSFTLILNERNRGASYGLNQMIARATGEFLGFVASDDWIEPGKSAAQTAYIAAHDLDAVLAPVKIFHESTGAIESLNLDHLAETIRSGRYLERLYQTDSGGAMTQSGLFRRAAVASIGGFREDFKSDDWLLMLRFLQAGFRLGFMDEAFTVYRLHGSNTHKNALYCLTELQLPVIQNFIPSEYRAKAIGSAYHSVAMKLLEDNWRESIAYEVRSMRAQPHPERLWVYLRCLLLNWRPLRSFYFSFVRPIRQRLFR